MRAILLLAILSGCTAIKGGIHLIQAETAIERAESRDAPEYAIYEYTLAERYLEKAREEVGRNQFRTATELAKSAANYADQSVISMEERGVGSGKPPPKKASSSPRTLPNKPLPTEDMTLPDETPEIADPPIGPFEESMDLLDEDLPPLPEELEPEAAPAPPPPVPVAPTKVTLPALDDDLPEEGEAP